MLNSINSIRQIHLPYDFADNGDLTVMEGITHVPFFISRVFVVRGFKGSIRGKHAHRSCQQFLTCPYGSVEVQCDDGSDAVTFVLDKPELGLLLPPSIWAQQTYLIDNSVLTVLCDRVYEKEDYIRTYTEFTEYRGVDSKIKDIIGHG